MHVWIPAGEPNSPNTDELNERIVAFESQALALRHTVSPKGSINRKILRETIAPAMATWGFTLNSQSHYGARELDYISEGQGVAVSLQAGRAMANNGALAATIAAAASRSTSTLILFIPEVYKKSSLTDRAHKQLRLLTRADGVSLALTGIAIISY